MPAQKVAVIDVGGSSMRAFVCTVTTRGDTLDVTGKKIAKCAIRLGLDVHASGAISAQKTGLLIAELNEYAAAIAAHNVDASIALATSAMRQATNADEILRRIRRDTPLTLHVIGGDTEAALLACGVLHSRRRIPLPLVCIDVGGGSTELVLCDSNGVQIVYSLPIGTMRLLSDPRTDLTPLADACRHIADRLPAQCGVVGLGGNINAFLGLNDVTGDGVIPLSAMRDVLEDMQSATVQQRRDKYGITEHRSEVLPLALTIFTTALHHLGQDALTAHRQGLVNGAAIALTHPATFHRIAPTPTQSAWQSLLQ